MHTDISLEKVVEAGIYSSLYKLGIITPDEFARLISEKSSEKYE
jgi:hypothetical protein